MRQYLPIPQKSGYQDVRAEFKAFAHAVESDFSILSNAVYGLTGQRFIHDDDDNSAAAAAPRLTLALPPLPAELAPHLSNLFRIRGEITDALDKCCNYNCFMRP